MTNWMICQLTKHQFSECFRLIFHVMLFDVLDVCFASQL